MTWPGHIHMEAAATPVQLEDLVVPRKARWEFRGENEHPDAMAKFEVRDGQTECVEIVLKAKPDGRGIRATDVAALAKVDDLTSAVVAQFAAKVVKPGEAIVPADPRQQTDVRHKASKAVDRSRTSRRGPAGPTHAELERAAEIYRQHLDGAPVQQVRSLLGLSESTARRRIQQARNAGLLPPTTPGRKKA